MIQSARDLVKKEFIKLKAYQEGELEIVRTGRPWLDSVFGGLIPGDKVVLAGQSGGGKTFESQKLKNFIMDEENNPTAGDFVWLDYSLEMRFLSTIIRDINTKTGKSKKRIVTEAFTEEEKEIVNKYYKTLRDGRFFMEEKVITIEEFREGLFKFLEFNKDKKGIFVAIDHIALFKGQDKKATVDAIVEIINEASKEYGNTYWIILSQLNREILRRIKDKDINAMPNRGDIFQSDSMFFIADYLYISHNPYKLGINAFSKVSIKQYEYLSEHFCEIKNGKASFETLGKMFFIILKLREGGVVFDDIYIEEVAIVDKDKYVKTFDSTQEEESEQEAHTPDFSVGLSALELNAGSNFE